MAFALQMLCSFLQGSHDLKEPSDTDCEIKFDVKLPDLQRKPDHLNARDRKFALSNCLNSHARVSQPISHTDMAVAVVYCTVLEVRALKPSRVKKSSLK